MKLSTDLQSFIDSPDTFDFIARANDSFFNFARDNSKVVLTQTLSGRYVLGYINQEHYDSLVESLGTSFTACSASVLGLLGRADLESAGILQVHHQPYLNLTGRGVLLGFVDTGIDYTQEVFRYQDGSSKIQFLYDQTVESGPPAGFFMGTEYDNGRINEALRAENPYDVVPQKDEVGHGTFLASVAAGRQMEDFLGAAPDAEIIAVKLQQAKPYYLNKYCIPEGVPAYSSNAVMIGIEYIIKKAEELGRPVVICLGLGTNFGSHDGFSVFEQYLSEISSRRGVCVCVAAGNESQARHHTTGKIGATGEIRNMDVEVSAETQSVCISLWNTVADRISVSIRSPSGELVSRVPARPGTASSVKLILEKARVNVEYHFPVEGSGGQLTLIRIEDATPGIWTITLYGDIILNGEYHAWLPLTGFIAPGVEFLSSSPYYTVTVPATAVGPVCCGAYDDENMNLYLNSSWGPARSGVMLPSLAAPGVEVGGYFPYGPGVMSGTSVAAAITAGACALMLQWGILDGNEPAMSTYQIRAFLIRGCRRSATATYPNERWGYGTLNLMGAFDLMRER